jgi:uncharacterized protein (TIGR03086 family)
VDPLVAHQRAQNAFAGILAQVMSDQLDLPTPCSAWDVRALVTHVIAGNVRVQQRAGANVDMPEVSDLPDLRRAHAETAEGAQAVFAAPDGLTRTFELPFGTIPGAAFIGIRAGDALTHAWDLARATGQPTDLDPEVATAAMAAARAVLSPELRGDGRPFGDEQPCPPGASPADELAAYLGRTVEVTPPRR